MVEQNAKINGNAPKFAEKCENRMEDGSIKNMGICISCGVCCSLRY